MTQLETTVEEALHVEVPHQHERTRSFPLALRTPLACVIYVAVLIALAVGIDRGISSRLFAAPSDYVPAYRSFGEYAEGVKLHQYASVKGRLDVTFVGNSRTLFGVDPAAFDATLARSGQHLRSYNLAVPSVDVRFWPVFFERYDKHPAPKHLVLGILPRDLDARFTTGGERVQEFVASAGFQNRNESWISRWADERMSHLYILRGRASDLQLVHPSDVLDGRRLDLHPIHLANAEGLGVLPPDNVLGRATLVAQERRLAHRHGTQQFELGRAQVAALVELNRWMRAHGGTLTLYTTPLLYDREPWGTIEMRRGFDRALPGLLARLPGVRFIDLGGQVQGSYGPQDYGDGDHLNRRGAERFSAQLADALAPMLAGAHR